MTKFVFNAQVIFKGLRSQYCQFVCIKDLMKMNELNLKLGGGFKDSSFSSLLGERIPF